MILRLKEILEQERAASVLNYGPPKSGKTRTLATLRALRRVEGRAADWKRSIWAFDFDWGIDALVTVAKRERWDEDELFVFRYTPPGGDKVSSRETRPRGKEVFMDFLRDFNSLYDNLDQHGLWWREPTIKLPSGLVAPVPYAIAFDGLSAFNDVVLDFVLNLASHDLNQAGTDARSDYGKQMGKVEETIISSNTLPCISVWNAHEVIDKDETTAQIRCDPYVTGKLAARIARHFGIVLYSTIEKGQYIWYTKPSGYVKTAGTRYTEGLPDKIAQDYAIVFGEAKAK